MIFRYSGPCSIALSRTGGVGGRETWSLSTEREKTIPGGEEFIPLDCKKKGYTRSSSQCKAYLSIHGSIIHGSGGCNRRRVIPNACHALSSQMAESCLHTFVKISCGSRSPLAHLCRTHNFLSADELRVSNQSCLFLRLH